MGSLLLLPALHPARAPPQRRPRPGPLGCPQGHPHDCHEASFSQPICFAHKPENHFENLTQTSCLPCFNPALASHLPQERNPNVSAATGSAPALAPAASPASGPACAHAHAPVGRPCPLHVAGFSPPLVSLPYRHLRSPRSPEQVCVSTVPTSAAARSGAVPPRALCAAAPLGRARAQHPTPARPTRLCPRDGSLPQHCGPTSTRLSVLTAVFWFGFP